MLTQVKQESGYSGRSTTTGNAIEVVRRGTTIGAEIQGVDFNRPLDDVTRDAILSALAGLEGRLFSQRTHYTGTAESFRRPLW
ncbi:MAG: hypothetical protein Q7T94_09795 [Rugosibacter sp.]|nr:hypothetical protein [Rugosibacter sp.]